MEGAGGQKLPLSPEPSRCRQSSKRGRQKAKRGSPVKATKSIPGRASERERPAPLGSAAKMLFPKGTAPQEADESFPHHPSKRRADT